MHILGADVLSLTQTFTGANANELSTITSQHSLHRRKKSHAFSSSCNHDVCRTAASLLTLFNKTLENFSAEL